MKIRLYTEKDWGITPIAKQHVLFEYYEDGNVVERFLVEFPFCVYTSDGGWSARALQRVLACLLAEDFENYKISTGKAIFDLIDKLRGAKHG